MKIGVPYQIGGGPIWIDIPASVSLGPNGTYFYTATKQVPFSGDVAAAYYAALAAQSEEPEK